jgi:hypothetical protein
MHIELMRMNKLLHFVGFKNNDGFKIYIIAIINILTEYSSVNPNLGG